MGEEKIKELKLVDLEHHLKNSIDLFICCSSYEERCKSVPDSINDSKLEKVIVCEHSNLSKFVRENATYLMDKFGSKATKVCLDSSDPLKSADAFSGALDQVQKGSSILIDITTFTHETLLILIKILLTKLKSASIRLAYNSAKDYSVNIEGRDKWLSKGLEEVRSILGYAGLIIPGKETHLILMVGFEHERAAKLIEAYEPNVISLGHGDKSSSTSNKHYLSNLSFKELLEETLATYEHVENFEFSASDPWKTSDSLNKLISNYSNYNTIIAPLNTKISSLGAALTAHANSKIQICYAQPVQYNFDHYSVPSDKCYLIEF